MKTVVTVTGIRPDFIRMSEIFSKLDNETQHILIHTGQHFDALLSDVFFQELKIRKPDYNLEVGGIGKEHFHQSSELSIKLIELLRHKDIDPDIILFLGDSNSVLASIPLKKEGYKIGHIEAGMRSYDRRMLEEINRVACDHVSDKLFVYHENYKKNCLKESITENTIHVVGNTIVEVCRKHSKDIVATPSKRAHILVDIHRPENFKYRDRLAAILEFSNLCSEVCKLPVMLLDFKRTTAKLAEYKLALEGVQQIPLVSYKQFLQLQYDSLFIVSDSGTAQEEPALLGVPVIVPRDFTERPESVTAGCSLMLDLGNKLDWYSAIVWASSLFCGSSEWLGAGNAADKIVELIC